VVSVYARASAVYQHEPRLAYVPAPPGARLPLSAQDLNCLLPKLVIRRQSSMFLFRLRNKSLHAFIITPQSVVERLFPVLVVNEPEATVLAFGVFVAVHLPIQNEWATPLQGGPADIASVEILLLWGFGSFQGKPIFSDEDSFPLDPRLGRLEIRCSRGHRARIYLHFPCAD
jgi:hypothetical protein